MKNLFTKIVSTLIFIFLLSASSGAQTTLFHSMPGDKPQFGLRYLRPDFDGDVDMSTFSGIYDFSLNAPISSNMNLVLSVPYMTYSFKRIDDESCIGNIYIGIQNRLKTDKHNNSAFSLGLFIPTTSDEKGLASMLSTLTNFHEFQKYTPDVLTVSANYAYHTIKPNNFLFGFEIGPNIYIPTESDEGEETEVYIHYGIRGGLQSSNLIFSMELLGLVIITEDVDEFDDRFLHTIVFGGQWNAGTFRPGLFYKIYLKDDLKDMVDGVLGIKLDICMQ